MKRGWCRGRASRWRWCGSSRRCCVLARFFVAEVECRCVSGGCGELFGNAVPKFFIPCFFAELVGWRKRKGDEEKKKRKKKKKKEEEKKRRGKKRKKGGEEEDNGKQLTGARERYRFNGGGGQKQNVERCTVG